MTFLVALIVGALRARVVQPVTRFDAGWTTAAIGLFCGAAVVGAAVVLGIERAAGGGRRGDRDLSGEECAENPSGAPAARLNNT